MLHELLLALLGYAGDLIIDEREHQQNLSVQISPDAPISDECTFKLASDISFIQPSERDVIERLIKLGFYYRELDRFATKSRNLSWIRSFCESPTSRTSEFLKGKKDKHCVYRRAIANGIIEILSVYRSAVLHIEQKLLSDSLPILATVTQGLNKFFVLLPPLYELILEIERDGHSGGRLLNLLHKRCHCGVPELQTCVQRYAFAIHLREVDIQFTSLYLRCANSRGYWSMVVKSMSLTTYIWNRIVNSDVATELIFCLNYRLLWHGHQVLYNQLASWMVYGILHDQYGEFFISR